MIKHYKYRASMIRYLRMSEDKRYEKNLKWTKDKGKRVNYAEIEKHEEMKTEMQKIFDKKKIRHEKIRSKSIFFSDHGPRHISKRGTTFVVGGSSSNTLK